jgi:hypothetical protein
MPRCQYRCDARGIQKDGVFSTPKSISDLDSWLKDAVASMCGIEPLLVKRNRVIYMRGWHPGPGEPVVTEGSILFMFQSYDGLKAALVIDRKFSQYAKI